MNTQMIERVLLSYPNGEPALWIDREPDGRYTLNDVNGQTFLDPDEDLDEIVADWKAAVGWDQVAPR
mgnify:FL=1